MILHRLIHTRRLGLLLFASIPHNLSISSWVFLLLLWLLLTDAIPTSSHNVYVNTHNLISRQRKFGLRLQLELLVSITWFMELFLMHIRTFHLNLLMFADKQLENLNVARWRRKNDLLQQVPDMQAYREDAQHVQRGSCSVIISCVFILL